MADVYKTVAGFVQFEPNVREHNGRELQDVLIQNIANQQDVRITIWPEAGLKAERGDFVVANGKFSSRERDGKTFYNLSANNDRVLVFKANTPSETVVNALDDEATDEAPIF